MASIVPVHIPQENVNDETVKIIHWLVADGDPIHTDQPLVAVETSKSTFEIHSPATGVIRRVVAEQLEVPVGDVLCYIGESLTAIETFRAKATVRPALAAAPALESRLQPANAGTPAPTVESDVTAVVPPFHGSRISRAALELIHSKGLNESDFSGRGLIRQRDVLARLGQAPPASYDSQNDERHSSFDIRHSSLVRGAAGVPVRTEPLPRSKRFEARLLSWSHRHAIRSAVTVAVPTRGLAELKRREPAAAEYLSAAVVFESARLLRKYPHLNAYASDEQISFYEQVNIGYALDAGQGLKVPVLREADGKTMPELIAQRREFLSDYLSDSIRPEAMAGSTFTVTDLSGDGVFSFDPLIVQAQSAILGVGAEFAGTMYPWSAAGTMQPSSAYNLVLAFDHRLIEGRMAAQFLGELKDRLQAHEDAVPGHIGPDAKAEPCCCRCLVSLSEIERMQGFLLHTAGRSKHETRLICSSCLAGF
jgi:pyruvate/2-oxoglutarate dehydrogenase complex dihydrolipoamide acyltransferase (E2) component